MPTEEQITSFYNEFTKRGRSHDEAMAYMTHQGWVSRIPDPKEQREEMLLYGAVQPMRVRVPKMTSGEMFAAEVAEGSAGFVTDVMMEAQDLPQVLKAAPPIALGVAYGKAIFRDELRQDAPSWRKAIRGAYRDYQAQATPSQKLLYFGGALGIDVLVGSGGKVATKPLAALMKRPIKRVLGDDFFREGMLFGVDLDEIMVNSLREDMVDQAASLGADISEDVLRQEHIWKATKDLIGTRASRAEIEEIVERQFLHRWAALYDRWAEQFSSHRGVVRDMVSEKASVIPQVADESSFLGVAGDIADASTLPGVQGRVSRAVGRETPVDAIKARFQDPQVTRSLPGLEFVEATTGKRIKTAESKLHDLYAKGLANESHKLSKLEDEVMEMVRGESREILSRKNVEDWIEQAGDRMSHDKLLQWNANKKKDVATKIGKRLDQTMAIAARQERISDDAKTMLGLFAQRASLHPSLVDDKGIQAAQIIDGGDGKSTHKFFQWVQRQFAHGTSAEFNEGASAHLASTFADPKAKKFWNTTFPAVYERYQGRLSGRLFQMSQARQDLSNSISEYAKYSGQSMVDVGKMVTKARTAKSYVDIPDSRLRDAAMFAQYQVDELSQEMLRLGLDDPLVDAFRENMGKYMHLSYANNYIDDWARGVKETAAWDNAFKWLVEKYGITKDRQEGLSDPQVRGLMLWLLNKQGGGALNFARGDLPKQALHVLEDIGVAKGGRPGATALKLQDLTEFRHRTDMPPVLRELFGVNKDFALDFEKTGVQMIEDLEATYFLRKVYEDGVKSGVIRMAPEEAGQGAYQSLMTFDRISPLDAQGYVTKEMHEVLESFDRQVSKSGMLATINGLVKAGKIVPSPGTQMRNFWSLWPMLLQSGIMAGADNPAAAAKAFKAFTFNTLKKGELPKDLARDFTRAHELRLIGTGALSGEMDIWVKQAADLMGSKPVKEIGGKFPTKVQEKSLKAWDIMRRAYTGIDDMGKFYGWQVYRERLSQHLLKDADDVAFARQLYDVPEDVIEEGVAEYAASGMIKNTMQHFPRTPVLGKTLARQPFFGTFVSFPLEMTRNLVHSLRYAGKEMQFGLTHSKPRWVTQGAGRLAGIMAATVGTIGAATFASKRLGIGDPQMEAIRRRLLAPWARNNTILPISKKGKKLTFADAGYSLPYSEVSELITAALARPGDMPTKILRVADQVEDVLLGNEIGASAIAGAALNTQIEEGVVSTSLTGESRRKIVSPEDPDQLMERMYYMIREMSPGALVSADRLVESMSGRRGFGLVPHKKRWQTYEPEAEVLSMFGLPRITTIDVGESVGWQVNRLRGEWEEFGAAFSTRLRSARTPRERYDLVAEFRPRWEKKLDHLAELRKDALNLDIPPQDWEEMVRGLTSDQDLRLRKKAREALIRGERIDILDAYPYLER